ncbi:MAG: EamA family transporter [Polyangiaceae bacterium]|nr:EamA family transporter [Polyangiaceae bacterium]
MDGPATTSPRPPSRARVVAILVVLCLVWGSTWLVVKWELADLPPFGSAGVRFAIAALAMAIVTPALRRREGGASPSSWLSILQGATNFGASYAIVYTGETALPSGLVATLFALFPLLMAVSGHFFLPGERLGRASAFGFAVGFGGVALLVWTDLAKLGPGSVPMALFVLVAPTVSTIGNTAVRRYGRQASSVVLSRDSMVVAAVLLCALALVFERDAPIHLTARAVLSVVFLALVGTCLTFGSYLYLMRYVPAARLSLIAFVTPAVALFLGWAVDSEPIYWHTIVGAALILVGVGLGALARGRAAPAPRPRES